MEKFLAQINYYQNQLCCLDVSSNLLDEIIYTMRGQMKDFGIMPEEFAAKLIGAGKGGDILFAVPFGHARYYIIDRIIDYLKKEINESIVLDYASWVDGFGREGAKIEQDLRINLRSKFISNKIVNLKIWKNSHSSTLTLISSDKLNKEIEDVDLLIDDLKKLIYIHGKKLTSKEIHSATTTIEILKVLLENIDKNVSNKNLPKSSYSNYRNEMQGKIIAPLLKTFEKYTGKELPLTLKGGLTNFALKINTSELDIRLVEKI